MVFAILPSLEYPVTWEFESKLFNRLAYAGAFLSLVILTIVNGMIWPCYPTASRAHVNVGSGGSWLRDTVFLVPRNGSGPEARNPVLTPRFHRQ
jgi:hypothetical protein